MMSPSAPYWLIRSASRNAGQSRKLNKPNSKQLKRPWMLRGNTQLRKILLA